MTRNPVTALPTDTVEHIASLMKSQDIGPVPVVDNRQTGRLIGIITDRDLVLKVVAEGRDPKSTRAEEVMSRELVTCRSNDALQKVFDAMARHRVRRIPVVDDRGAIVGIIAQADVATRLEEPEKTAAVVEEISKPG